MSVAEDYYATMERAFEAGPPPGLTAAAELLSQAVANGKALFTFGNGASAALASHMATDIGKGTSHDHGLDPWIANAQRARILSLADNASLLTAYGNDVGYEFVFVEQLRGLLRCGDVAIGISASGSSPNVLRALEYARSHGGTCVGLTGGLPGAADMEARCDVVVKAPVVHIDQIEDMHVSFNHILMRMLDVEFMRLRGVAGSADGDAGR